jgi:hypothetical protein
MVDEKVTVISLLYVHGRWVDEKVSVISLLYIRTYQAKMEVEMGSVLIFLLLKLGMP